MLRKLSLLVALSFFLAFSPAGADGNELLKYCLEAERVLDSNNKLICAVAHGYCLGLIEGVRDTTVDFDNLMVEDEAC